MLEAVHKGPGSRATVKPGSTVTMEEAGSGGGAAARITNKEKPFDSMNSIVANLLLNMTRLVGQVTHCHHSGNPLKITP